MNSLAPNLYQLFNLDPNDGCDSLGLLLAGKSANLEQTGYDNPNSQQLTIAYGILSNEQHRTVNDSAVIAGRNLTWAELEQLANFGQLPEPYQPQMSAAASSPSFGTTTHNPQQIPGMPSFNAHSQLPAPTMAGILPVTTIANRRATLGARIGMALLDSFIALVGCGASLFPFFEGGSFFSGIVVTLLVSAYVVGCETFFGATPAKLIFGYTVRDVTTGKKLSVQQSARRNWWRLVNVIPFLGSAISFIGAIVSLTSINSANELRGHHDRLANAEVVKTR